MADLVTLDESATVVLRVAVGAVVVSVAAPALIVAVSVSDSVGAVTVRVFVPADREIDAARVALGAVAPTVLLSKECADALIGTKVDDAALDRLAAAASAACRPIDDKRGTKEFRITVAGVIARRVAQKALERAKGIA